MKKKVKILTNNRELYNKLSQLNFSNEVLLNNVKPMQVTKIMRTINKNGKILEHEIINKDYIIVKKKNGILNFDIYFKA